MSTSRTCRGLVLLAMALLTGCAAQVKRAPIEGSSAVRVPAESGRRIVLQVTADPEIERSKDWEQFKGEWRAAFKAETGTAGIAFAVYEGDDRPPAAAGTLLSVFVNDYRYLSPGARYGFGVMTGNAYIDARIGFSDLQTGQRFGEQRINTTSTAWEGIFSAMTEKQVQAIAKEVVADVKPR